MLLDVSNDAPVDVILVPARCAPAVARAARRCSACGALRDHCRRVGRRLQHGWWSLHYGEPPNPHGGAACEEEGSRPDARLNELGPGVSVVASSPAPRRGRASVTVGLLRLKSWPAGSAQLPTLSLSGFVNGSPRHVPSAAQIVVGHHATKRPVPIVLFVQLLAQPPMVVVGQLATSHMSPSREGTTTSRKLPSAARPRLPSLALAPLPLPLPLPDDPIQPHDLIPASVNETIAPPTAAPRGQD